MNFLLFGMYFVVSFHITFGAELAWAFRTGKRSDTTVLAGMDQKISFNIVLAKTAWITAAETT